MGSTDERPINGAARTASTAVKNELMLMRYCLTQAWQAVKFRKSAADFDLADAEGFIRMALENVPIADYLAWERLEQHVGSILKEFPATAGRVKEFLDPVPLEHLAPGVDFSKPEDPNA